MARIFDLTAVLLPIVNHLVVNFMVVISLVCTHSVKTKTEYNNPPIMGKIQLLEADNKLIIINKTFFTISNNQLSAIKIFPPTHQIEYCNNRVL